MAVLSALRSDLQTRVLDKSGNFLSATPANLYLNLACEDFQNDVQPVWREYGYYVTAKQFRYDLPADFIHTRTMMWYQNGQFEIPYKSPQEFKQLALLNKRITVSKPLAYTIIDNDIYLGPAPGASSNTSTLGGAHNATTTTIYVGDGTQFMTHAGIILVESEQIAYQSVNVNALELAIRGQGGTTAATHTPGSGSIPVYRLDLVMVYAAAHITMSTDTDTPAFSSRFHRYVVPYATYLALKQDGREEEAAAELALYHEQKLQAKREVRRQMRDKMSMRASTSYT